MTALSGGLFRATFSTQTSLGHDPTLQLTHLVVYVEAPLARVLAHDTRFLQQEVINLAPVWFPASAELDLKIFALGSKKGTDL